MRKKFVAVRIMGAFKRLRARVHQPSYRAGGILFILTFAIILALGFQRYGDRIISIERSSSDERVQFSPHPLTGIRCANYEKRPFAVMMAQDPLTRPLSGIAAADIVIEMPVGNDGITRIMALFMCEEASEIGSVRSARDDFIPLAASFDAIFGHWGGSSFALEQLNASVLDNIDALPNPTQVFFRKQGVPGPHDGFTTYEALKRAAQFLEYRLQINHEGYPIADERPSDTATTSLIVGYTDSYNVHYLYNRFTNTYLRWRAGSPERDAIDGRQAEVSVVIVLVTDIQELTEEYNDVAVTGSGRMLVFQNGTMQEGTWEKDGGQLTSPMEFLTVKGEDMALVAGKKWIEIVSPDIVVQWGEEQLQ